MYRNHSIRVDIQRARPPIVAPLVKMQGAPRSLAFFSPPEYLNLTARHLNQRRHHCSSSHCGIISCCAAVGTGRKLLMTIAGSREHDKYHLTGQRASCNTNISSHDTHVNFLLTLRMTSCRGKFNWITSAHGKQFTMIFRAKTKSNWHRQFFFKISPLCQV